MRRRKRIKAKRGDGKGKRRKIGRQGVKTERNKGYRARRKAEGDREICL